METGWTGAGAPTATGGTLAAGRSKGTAALAAARTQRGALVVRLRRERKLADGQIASLEAVARRVERKSEAIQVAASSEPVQVVPAAAVPAASSAFMASVTFWQASFSLAGSEAFSFS